MSGVQIHVTHDMDPAPTVGGSDVDLSADCIVTRVDYTTCVGVLELCCNDDGAVHHHTIEVDAVPMLPFGLAPGDSVRLELMSSIAPESPLLDVLVLFAGEEIAFAAFTVDDGQDAMPIYDLESLLPARSGGEFLVADDLCVDPVTGGVRRGITIEHPGVPLTAWDNGWAVAPSGARAIIETFVVFPTDQHLRFGYSRGDPGRR